MSAAEIPVVEPVVSTVETAEFRRRITSISRHSAVYFVGALFSASAGYLLKIYLARTLGAEALGLYALGISVVSIVGLFNAAGLPTAGARFVAEYSSAGDYVRLGAFLRGVFGILGVGNLLLGAVLLALVPRIAVKFYHAPTLASYSWALAAIMLLAVVNTFLGQCMVGYRAVARRSMITQFAGTFITIIATVVLISLRFGLAGYFAAQVASAAVVFGLLSVSVWKLTPPAARRTRGFGGVERRVVTFSATSFGLAIVHFVLGQSDKITLGHYLSAKDVGVYAIAMTMVGLIPLALTSVNQIFSPTIAELHAAGNYALLQRLYVSLTKWILILTLPLALSVIIFSASWMSIFGPAFRDGATALSVGAIGQIFNCVVGSVGFLLLMSDKQTSLMKIQVVNAIVMVLLNLLLVPRFGMVGAAVAVSVGVAATNLWGLLVVRAKLRLFPYDRSYFKVGLAMAMTAAVLLVFHKYCGQGSWRVAVAATAIAYTCFFAGVLFLGLGSEDRMLVRTVRERIWVGGNGVSDEQYA